MAQSNQRKNELGQQKQVPTGPGEKRKRSPSLPERGQASRDEARMDRDQVRDDPREPRDESRLG